MPSITFFALLNEAHKLDVYEKKMLITIAAYPHIEKEKQDEITASLLLPDDVLSDIVESETPDDINILKEALEDGN
jgi:hypothetical protein